MAGRERRRSQDEGRDVAVATGSWVVVVVVIFVVVLTVVLVIVVVVVAGVEVKNEGFIVGFAVLEGGMLDVFSLVAFEYIVPVRVVSFIVVVAVFY